MYKTMTYVKIQALQPQCSKVNAIHIEFELDCKTFNVIL